MGKNETTVQALLEWREESKQQIAEREHLLRKIFAFVYGGNHRPPITAEDFRPLMKEIEDALQQDADEILNALRRKGAE